MPNRILRDGILTSESVSALSWAEEVFYRRLMSVADDHGRFHAAPKLIRAACYPLLIDKVSDADIGKWLTSCVTAALVSVYPAADGKRYLQITKFGQQVRAKSKFPEPSDSDAVSLLAIDSSRQQPPADAHLGVSVFGVVSEVGGEGRKRRPPKSSMPENFGISERVKAWAAEKGYDRLADHLDAFRLKVAKGAYTYADWDAALMEAIREDWAKLRGRPMNGAAPAAGNGITVADNPQSEATRQMLAADREREKALADPDEQRRIAERIAEARQRLTRAA